MLQQYAPVLVSIGLIIALAVLRNRSRTVAALLVTMPINLTLGVWIVSSGDVDRAGMLTFVRSALVGLTATFAWIIAVYVLLRAGWPVWAAVVGGYAVWASGVGVLLALGLLRM